MIVTLPYIYALRGTLKGKRAPETHWILDEVPVDIRVVEDVALQHVSARRGLSILGGMTIATKYPVFENCIYQPLERPPVMSDVALSPETLDTLARLVLRQRLPFWQTLPVDLAPPRGPDGPQSVNVLQDLHLRDVESSDREAAAARAVKSYRRMVAVNGVLYVTIPEFIWTVHPNRKRDPDGAKIRLLTAATVHDDLHVFRVDRLEDAKALARRLANGGQVKCEDQFEGADLVTWRRDDVVTSVELAAKAAFKSLENQALRHAPEEFFPAMIALRKLLANGVRTREDVSAFLPIAREMLGALDGWAEGERYEFPARLNDVLGHTLWRLAELDGIMETPAPEDVSALSLQV